MTGRYDCTSLDGPFCLPSGAELLQDQMYDTKQEVLVEEDRFSAENVQKLVYERLNPTPKRELKSSTSVGAEDKQSSSFKKRRQYPNSDQQHAQSEPSSTKGGGKTDATRDFAEELGFAAATRAAARDVQCVFTNRMMQCILFELQFCRSCKEYVNWLSELCDGRLGQWEHM